MFSKTVKVIDYNNKINKGEYNDVAFKLMKVPTSFTQLYTGSEEVLLKRTHLALKLYLFLIMYLKDDDNCIYISKVEKLRFIATMGNNTKLQSVDNALRELVKVKLIRKIDRAVYYINPLYATRNIDKKRRMECIVLNEQANGRASVVNGANGDSSSPSVNLDHVHSTFASDDN